MLARGLPIGPVLGLLLTNVAAAQSGGTYDSGGWTLV